jgi:hypothetical protein
MIKVAHFLNNGNRKKKCGVVVLIYCVPTGKFRPNQSTFG